MSNMKWKINPDKNTGIIKFILGHSLLNALYKPMNIINNKIPTNVDSENILSK